jgi:hypothetical protein
MTFLNETVDEWSKFHCRGTDGWLKTVDVTDIGILEINFVDIGQGDGCHIVTPAGEIILVDAGEGVGLIFQMLERIVRVVPHVPMMKNFYT